MAEQKDVLVSLKIVGNDTIFKPDAELADTMNAHGDGSKKCVGLKKLAGSVYVIEYEDGTFDKVSNAPVIARFEAEGVVHCTGCKRPVGGGDLVEEDGKPYCGICGTSLRHHRRQAEEEARRAAGDDHVEPTSGPGANDIDESTFDAETATDGAGTLTEQEVASNA